MLDFLFDGSLLSALALAAGPLAIFAAPTEEIEALLFDTPSQEDDCVYVIARDVDDAIPEGLPEALGEAA